MKKIFTLSLALIACAGTIFAEKVQIGDLYYNLNAASHMAEVTSQNSHYPYWSTSITEANIPQSVTFNAVTYSVTSIGESAFSGCSGLANITIPNSVTSIGDYVFKGCSSLTSITIPISVTSIGSYTFEGCTGLTSVSIPNSVTSIGDWAFAYCSGLTMPIYNDHVFAYMPTSYSGAYAIPDGIESIAGGAFRDCSGLTSVSIPNSVTSIGHQAFWGCSSLISVNIPNSVTSIGACVFKGCSSLTSIAIPISVTSIGGSVFSECSSLTSVVWNAIACTDVDKTLFQGAPISSLVIGDSVKQLPADFCYYMNSLSSVHISDIAAWCRINFLDSKTSNPLYYAHHLYLNNEEIINLVIPEGVTEISNRAFAGYSAMKTISIPSSVVRIGHTTFDGCTGLTSVVIPDGVTTIGNMAFTRCSNLQSVVLGDNVTTIGEGVFTGCTSLESPIYNRHTFICMPSSYIGAYTIPDGINTIAGSAFYKCKELTSIDIPNSVMVIGEAAFRECTKLENVTIGTGVTALGENVFNKCASIKKVQWNAINYRQQKPNGDSNCFPFYSSRDSITSFIFGDSVEYIPAYILKDFSAIHCLVIPASVTKIGEYAFTNDNLVQITCIAETPPIIDSTAVVGVNKSTCILYVPYTSVNAYRNAEVWKEFVNIQAIGAEEVEEPGDAIVVTPSSTSASLIWTLISNAATYELVIRDMNGNVICTLTFNALGQLTGIAFAPNRSREAQQIQAAGFQFTVSGLNSGTTYEYALTAFDENDNIIETLTGTFTTTGEPQGIEDVNVNNTLSKKIIRDGNVYILRGEKVFTLQGQEAK